MELGKVGVWLTPQTLRTTPAEEERRGLRRIEELGYGSVWTGEPPKGGATGGKEIFSHLGIMLAATERIVVGSGIANMSARGPVAMQSGGATLAEAYPGRFILGVGGSPGAHPVGDTRNYLDRMDEAFESATPARLDDRFPRVLAALGPKMVRLGAERTDGVHPFNMPVAQTRMNREAIGPDKLLIPHQAVVLETDPGRARAVIRELFGQALSHSAYAHYATNYRRLGFTDADLAGSGSDRLIDAVFAWGDADAIAARIQEHLDAGADHVLVHPFAGGFPAAIDDLVRLAPALIADYGMK